MNNYSIYAICIFLIAFTDGLWAGKPVSRSYQVYLKDCLRQTSDLLDIRYDARQQRITVVNLAEPASHDPDYVIQGVVNSRFSVEVHHDYLLSITSINDHKATSRREITSLLWLNSGRFSSVAAFISADYDFFYSTPHTFREKYDVRIIEASLIDGYLLLEESNYFLGLNDWCKVHHFTFNQANGVFHQGSYQPKKMFAERGELVGKPQLSLYRYTFVYHSGWWQVNPERYRGNLLYKPAIRYYLPYHDARLSFTLWRRYHGYW